MSKRIHLQLAKSKATMSNVVNRCPCIAVEIRSLLGRSLGGRMGGA